MPMLYLHSVLHTASVLFLAVLFCEPSTEQNYTKLLFPSSIKLEGQCHIDSNEPMYKEYGWLSESSPKTRFLASFIKEILSLILSLVPSDTESCISMPVDPYSSSLSCTQKLKSPPLWAKLSRIFISDFLCLSMKIVSTEIFHKSVC